MVVLAIYVGSFLFGWLQGRLTAVVVQRTVYAMRQDVEAKLSRLPLKYIDSQPRGELLSRVTNDIDNVAQTLQQTLSQLITSVLTVVGVLVMMFCHLAAARRDRAGHRAAVDRRSRGPSPSGRGRSSWSSGRGPASSTPTSRRCTPATRW